jgi:hypothetical protein
MGVPTLAGIFKRIDRAQTNQAAVFLQVVLARPREPFSASTRFASDVP